MMETFDRNVEKKRRKRNNLFIKKFNRPISIKKEEREGGREGGRKDEKEK